MFLIYVDINVPLVEFYFGVLVKQIDYRDIVPQIQNNTFKFYNFYNVDIDPEVYYGVQYYKSNDETNIKQILKTVFLDIESYRYDKTLDFKFDESLHPISAITFYFKKIFYVYYLDLYNVNLDNVEIAKKFKKYLSDEKYIKPNEEIKITCFTDEIKLLTSLWTKIRELDPVILSGWNCHYFDFPYIYRRMLVLLNNDETKVNSIISQFHYVRLYRDMLEIAEFQIADLMYLYKPRDPNGNGGGRNYGKTRPSYTLDYISEVELGLNKLNYKDESFNLDEFYENDLENYVLYNIIDTALCVRLNDKLKHIELHNTIRRMMNSTFSKSLIGSSTIFDSYVLHTTDKKIRFGMAKQDTKNIPIEKFEHYPRPRIEGKKTKTIEPIVVKQSDYNSNVFKFDGAYVTKPKNEVISKGLSFSLDASSMYPSIMLQHNISFDSYRARIIPSTVYKLLNYLRQTLGQVKKVPEQLLQSSIHLINTYIDSKEHKLQKKEETRRILLYTTMFFLNQLYEANIPFINIIKPKTDKQQFLLSFYLIHLLNIMDWVHPNKESFNDIIYDYVYDEKNFHKKYSEIYIIKNINNPGIYIDILNKDQMIEEIKNYSLTITGTCFEKHETYLGLFTNLLEDLFKMRKNFQNEMSKYEEGTDEYDFFDQNQKSVKVVMNSIYGTQGLKSFRYSDSQLAHSITTQGKMLIKLAQYVTDNYLDQQFGSLH